MTDSLSGDMNPVDAVKTIHSTLVMGENIQQVFTVSEKVTGAAMATINRNCDMHVICVNVSVCAFVWFHVK